MSDSFTTIKELPDSERPYEKFLKSGAESLSDAELLAVIIRSGTQGRKSIEVSQEFLGMGNTTATADKYMDNSIVITA